MLKTVDLRAPVFLVPGRKLHEGIVKQRRDYPALPGGLDEIVANLSARRDGVPVTFTPWKGSDAGFSVQLTTYAYVVRLGLSGRGDAYFVNWVAPLRLRDHDELAKGCLLVRAVWRPVLDIRQVPQGADAGWNGMFRAWQQLQTELGNATGAPQLNAQHARFLDTLDRLNDAVHRLEHENADQLPTYPYSTVEPVGERRYSAAGMYRFHVVGGVTPEPNAFVQVRGEVEQRGHVTRVTDGKVTVRFDRPVDWARLAQQGELTPTMTDVAYAKRRDAIALLRARQARNSSLLDVLVDHRVQPIDQVNAEPGEELDRGQLAAFSKSLGVRDLVIVLGPPGTGKTRTITQIARAHALGAGPGRLLVASHTNRAVDNVLAKLPRDVMVVRVGNESKIDPDARQFLLERFAADLRGQVIATTADAVGRYAGVPHARDWHAELERRIAKLDEAFATEEGWRAEWIARRRIVGVPAQEKAERLAARLAELERTAAGARSKAERLSQRLARARRRLPVLAFLTDAVTRRRQRRLATANARLLALGEEASTTKQALDQAEAEVDLATRDVPAVRDARARLDGAVRESAERRKEAIAAATAIAAALGPVLPVPPVDSAAEPGAMRQALGTLHAQLGPHLQLLTARRAVLADWHEDVRGATEQLHPELIRYADVVGATCIGAASRAEIADEEFDLTIVDEAGQIATADVLVPLVRARRAVLVGDHRQLPPIVELEVLALLGEAAHDPAVQALLQRSTLENLVGALPASHVEMLTQQRRMPKVIADFVSDTFYDGKLRTMVTRVHDDDVFASPLAFVDLSDLPEAKRRERSTGQGRENVAEARLLSRLATHYHVRGKEWALIVPYAAQRRLVVSILQEHIPDQDVVQSGVGTVDSFQGGERDVILYGFTRSNSAAQVGFLDELRRANVAFTRAKQQLVLVGDLEMLLRARDTGFRELMRKLHEHLLADGDLRRSAEIWHGIGELA
ncbi:MAG TPA: AAA domain-containing protein [Amycolatopsis sp.]|uniref:DEAD/DEAH box helicase n=1 Tax=Amycolatopsis sp. TaxID=37632 RepID=UPI002B4979D6|nr:AAA domain-containing protein [Amycolatopsis sp.]HKS47084.1 AAA domain-containing protein [Amycolatopsis sp.]